MKPTIYPAAIHAKLALMEAERLEGTKPKVLDCGAGGETPPLGLFYQAGYECWGIDISAEQIRLAQESAKAAGQELNFVQGNMRELPFEDESFDFVYEFNAIAHLTKADTGKAVAEMRRVLRKGGLCFLGFMALDSWPIIGRKTGDGEFSLVEGKETVTHSAYADDEPEKYFTDWIIVQKEKQRKWYREWAARMELADWMRWYDPAHSDLTESEWKAFYGVRAIKGNNSQLLYVLRKPY